MLNWNETDDEPRGFWKRVDWSVAIAVWVVLVSLIILMGPVRSVAVIG